LNHLEYEEARERRRHEWLMKWTKRCAADARLERVACALALARNVNPFDTRKGLDYRWMDVVNPPDRVIWLVGEPYWKEYQQEAWEFIHMQDASRAITE
jgi:hypothetical protein